MLLKSSIFLLIFSLTVPLIIDRFTVSPDGAVIVRCRKPGDRIRLNGGTKKLKELFVDLKIPAAQRDAIPVVADDNGVLGVYGIGANLDRVSDTGMEICFEKIEKRGEYHGK